MLDAGLFATVNSDAPAYFGGHINENLTQSFAALGMDARHAYALASNSFEASFVDQTRKDLLLRRLDKFFAEFEPSPDAALAHREPRI